MSQVLHSSHLGALDLIRRRLAHVRCSTPVILARQKVDRAFAAVDLVDAVAGVETTEVEVQVTMEDAVGLAGVHVPYQLLVDVGAFRCLEMVLVWDVGGGKRGGGYHHAPDPVRVKESLIDDR